MNRLTDIWGPCFAPSISRGVNTLLHSLTRPSLIAACSLAPLHSSIFCAALTPAVPLPLSLSLHLFPFSSLSLFTCRLTVLSSSASSSQHLHRLWALSFGFTFAIFSSRLLLGLCRRGLSHAEASLQTAAVAVGVAVGVAASAFAFASA